MNDLISRQAAIDALRDYLVGKRCPDDGTLTCRLIENEVINKLPSAQPEPCEDAVSRETVKEQMLKYGFRAPDMTVTEFVEDCLPSVTPKQRMGKWILDRSGAYCCSECMEPCAGYVMMKPRDKFCKMCGAKMGVTE